MLSLVIESSFLLTGECCHLAVNSLLAICNFFNSPRRATRTSITRLTARDMSGAPHGPTETGGRGGTRPPARDG